MRVLSLLLLLVTISIAQLKHINESIFFNPATNAMMTNDTIGSISANDSVFIQMGIAGPWYLLTKVNSDTAYITGDDKVLEQVVQFRLADETYWTHVDAVRFEFRSLGVDTSRSLWVYVGDLYGRLTLDVQPDTSGTNTHYSGSTLHGN